MNPRFLLSLTIAILSGCNPAQHNNDVENFSAQASATSSTIIDRLNRQVVFNSPPQRIVCLSPATTELVFAIGAGNRLVGATEYCNHPIAAQKISRVGSGPMGTISLESIVAKKPDLVLCKFDTHQPLIESLERLNIPVLALGPESLEELCNEAAWLGEALDCVQSAEQLIQSLQTRRDQLISRVQQLSEARQRVYYEVWGDPMMSAGRGSFIDELLDLAGLDNIVSDTVGRYPRINPELIVQADPQVILVPSSTSEKSVDKSEIESILHRPGWQNVSAIRQGRVYSINGDVVSRCGPRMMDALEQMIQAAYPEARQ